MARVWRNKLNIEWKIIPLKIVRISMLYSLETKKDLSCQTAKVRATGQNNCAPDVVPGITLDLSFLTKLQSACLNILPIPSHDHPLLLLSHPIFQLIFCKKILSNKTNKFHSANVFIQYRFYFLIRVYS